MVFGAQIFRQNTWVLKKDRTLSTFLCGILHQFISITKLSKKKKTVHVSQFCINHLSHLNVWLVSDQELELTLNIKLCGTLIWA